MRVHHAVLLVAVWVLLALWTMPVKAQVVCKPRDEIVTMLQEKYKEHRRVYAMANNLQVLELFVAESGTWTALISQTNGTSCLVAAGTDWTEEELSTL